MALKPCRECKKKISTEAISCPNCGVPNPAATLEKQNNSKLEDTNKNYKKINLNFIKNKPAKLKKYFKIGIVVLAIYSAVPSLWFWANIVSQPKYGFKYFVSHFIPTTISREDVVTWRDNQEYYKIDSFYTFVPFYSNLFKSKNFVAQKLFYIHKKNNKKEYEFFGYRDLKNDKIVYRGAQIYYYDYSTEKIVYIKGEYNSWRGYRCLKDDCGVVDFQKSKPLDRIREASIDEVESLISYYKNISDKFVNSIDYNTIIKIVDSKGKYVDKNIIVKNNYENNKTSIATDLDEKKQPSNYSSSAASWIERNNDSQSSSSNSSALNAIEHGLNTLSGNTNSGYGTTRLYYDNSSGGMRECSYEPLNGRCFTFKPFNRNSYSRDTLFYNPKEKTMQPCIGPVTALGKCTAFGLFRKTPNSTSQLFYDEENNKMTTCSHVGVDGKCYHFRLAPKKEYRGFQSQSKTNPYYFKAPETSSDLIEQGLNMLGGGCTLGRNC